MTYIGRIVWMLSKVCQMSYMCISTIAAVNSKTSVNGLNIIIYSCEACVDICLSIKMHHSVFSRLRLTSRSMMAAGL